MGSTITTPAALLTVSLIPWLIAIVAAVAAIIATLLLRRRWNWASKVTDHPFAKYVVLSVVAHFVLAIWAYTARLSDAPEPGIGTSLVTVELGDELAAAPHEVSPWDPPTKVIAPDIPEMPPASQDVPPPISRPAPILEDHSDPRDSLDSVVPDEPAPAPLDLSHDRPAAPATLMTDVMEPGSRAAEVAATASATTAGRHAPDLLLTTTQQSPVLNEAPTPSTDTETAASDHSDTMRAARTNSSPRLTADVSGTQRSPQPLRPAQASRPLRPITSSWGKGDSPLPIRKAATSTRSDGRPIPGIYSDRRASDRLDLVRARGGGADTEAAVQLAIQWLASVQSADGRWDASHFGAGQAVQVDGHDRREAGLQADTGVTGLALLAYLGAGHTHQHGPYSQTIKAGIEFLLRAQQARADGSIVGNSGGFAAMYCHGIATLALSECYALTGDASLRNAVRRAVAFSLAAQHPGTGGWRYRPQETGDTSQLGWQVMALTSAHYGGIQIPRSAWTGAARFLNSVAWGSHGGLASYRPGEPPSKAMTAEALLCRLFLGIPPDHPLVDEGANDLMNELPGSGRVNYYYWYYGTLALYQLQDQRWSQWNAAMKSELLRQQRTVAAHDGSWDPDSVWGRSGGRVYTTALAVLSLEVYYRYRPRNPAQRRPERTAWNGKGFDR